jgi:hypothetical protein
MQNYFRAAPLTTHLCFQQKNPEARSGLRVCDDFVSVVVNPKAGPPE